MGISMNATGMCGCSASKLPSAKAWRLTLLTVHAQVAWAFFDRGPCVTMLVKLDKPSKTLHRR